MGREEAYTVRDNIRGAAEEELTADVGATVLSAVVLLSTTVDVGTVLSTAGDEAVDEALPRDAVVVSSGSTVVGSGVRREEYDIWSVGVTAWSVDERTRENVEGVAIVTGRPVTDAELEYVVIS
eukprot:sb/3475790/